MAFRRSTVSPGPTARGRFAFALLAAGLCFVAGGAAHAAAVRTSICNSRFVRTLSHFKDPRIIEIELDASLVDALIPDHLAYRVPDVVDTTSAVKAFVHTHMRGTMNGFRRRAVAGWREHGDLAHPELHGLLRPGQLYNFVVMDRVLRLTEEGARSLGGAIAAKHVFVSGYDGSVRLAGTLRMDADGLLILVNSTGSYPYPVDRLRKAKPLFRTLLRPRDVRVLNYDEALE